MDFKKIELKSNAIMTSYIIDKQPDCCGFKAARPAVLILPGGGYRQVVDHESECIALQFCAEGYHAFILNYSVNEDGEHPCMWLPLRQLCEAVSLIREKADAWYLDPDRIAVCGFSAGGHLAACLGTYWNTEWFTSFVGIDAYRIKPDALVLGYPGIDISFPSAKMSVIRSYVNIAGEDRNDPIWDAIQIEKKDVSSFPPTFIWHTGEDECVSPRGSIKLADKLVEKGIPVELHIFPFRKHAISLATMETAQNEDYIDMHVARWKRLCFEFLQTSMP